MPRNSIILENEKFRLELSQDCVAKSLVLKSNGAECLYKDAPMPFFSLTEERPFNNEIKLAHPNKRTTFGANRVRMEYGRLIVGFELIDFEAVVDVNITPRYMVFILKEFIVKPDSFGLGVLPMLPPVYEFRLVQLPVAPRERFGEWLNVVWDGEAAVNVLGASPYSLISSEKRRGYRILFGDTLRDVKLKNTGVALIVSEPGELLDAIDVFEKDLDLPRGAESRRSPLLNRSYYWASNVTPETVDTHIEYALKGGFRFMSIYYCSVVKDIGGYLNNGEYGVYRDEYRNGREDLVKMLKKIKAAGITPGLHVLHTHIGLRTHYLTPSADHRLNLVKRFTLSKPISANDTTIYVEEDTEGCPEYEKLRVLRFMGELISYESFSTERPYCFNGCKRGFNDTVAKAHDIGTIGGILDVSEFVGNSAYIDQRTSLQDEIAEGIAKIYDAGFEFMYFDGSEGTNPPFDINVGLAQWRVYRKLGRKPIFCEGAAKSHFSWHMLSGGNAFDVWSPECFKEMIAKHPFAEAPRMANDFTRLNFGWWGIRDGQRADIVEYGTALAAAWECPGAFQANLNMLASHPRTDDILETFRRWEDARVSGFVTPEIKAELKKTEVEHTLLIDEKGDYELVAYEHIKNALRGDGRVTVFVFERNGKTCALCWNNTGRGDICVPINAQNVSYVESLGGDELPIKREGGAIIIETDRKRYLITELSRAELIEAFENAELL
ncbi:MAG: hypothetical protein E7634_03945 [Ruminococcaceae bacterium]|nr:hypothetical protein [Oscillospiraceae bacterium]